MFNIMNMRTFLLWAKTDSQSQTNALAGGVIMTIDDVDTT